MNRFKFRTFRFFNLFRVSIFVLSALIVAVPSGATAATIVASDKPAFQADLTNTLKLQAGTGNPTFTRATTAYQTDFEGLMHQVLSGEARFHGARRVQNWVTYNTEDMTGWAKIQTGTASAPVVTANAVANPVTGAVTASQIRLNRGAGNTLSDWSAIGAAVGTFAGTSVGSVYVRGTSGEQVAFRGVGASAYTVITFTGSWQRVSAIETWVGGSFSLANRGTITSTNDVTFYAYGLQVESIAGQTNQNPSEYVSNGVLAAPYHGAGVNGVQYFNTLNGNTVASNVVTAGTGALITSAQSAAAGGVSAGVVDATGPLGYLAEGARTNLVLQSEDFSTTWGTVGASTVVTTDQTTAPNGTATADKITESSGGTTHTLDQSVTKAASAITYTLSFYVKPNGRNWVRVLLGNHAVSDYSSSWFNVSTGAVGLHGATTNFTDVGESITAVGNGWYRVKVTATSDTGTEIRSFIYLATADNSASYSGDGTSGVYLWGAQLEASAFASSYIPTTIGSAARNADVLTYPASGNINTAVGTFSSDVFLEGNTGGAAQVVLGANPTKGFYNGSTNGTVFTLYDGTTLANIASPTSALTSVIKVAGNWGASLHQIFAQGTAGVATVFSGDMQFTTAIGIGIPASGISNSLYGTIRNVKIWQKALTNTQLTAMTNTNTAVARTAIPQTTVNASTNTSGGSLTSGLVGLWSFDGKDMQWTSATTGTAFDRSGAGNNGTLVGMSQSTSPTIGKIGQALKFTGTGANGSYVNAGASTGNYTNNFTIATWFKFSAAANLTELLGRWDYIGALRQYILRVNYANTIVFYDSNAVAYSATVTGIGNVGTWHHVTVAVNGSSSRIYVDGVAVGSVFTPTIVNISSSFLIGTVFNSAPTISGGFNGSLDDVRLYNRALSATEVKALYNLGK